MSQYVDESTVGYYQSNTCKLSLFDIQDVNFFNNSVEFLPDKFSSIKCSGKVNGVDYFEDGIKIYIGTNLLIDFFIQSFFWLVFIFLIPKKSKNLSENIKPITFLIMSIIIYLHFLGEKNYYLSVYPEFETNLSFTNFRFNSIMITFLLLLFIFKDLVGSRLKNFINYIPFLFLLVGTYNTFNINFFYILIVFIGVHSFINTKKNFYLISSYLIIATVYFYNLEKIYTNFDVDKIKGFVNSSESTPSLIYWVISFYFFIYGIMYLINSSKKSFDHILFRKNLIWSGSLIVIIGILSSFNRILNFYFYYYLGLNKFGMKSFESIQGNTWRGLSSSAEAVGEYFIFIIIFIIFSLFKNYKNLNYFELIGLIIICYGIFRANNKASLISGVILIFIFLLITKVSNLRVKIFGFLLFFTGLLIVFQQINDYPFGYYSKGMLYHATLASNIESSLSLNQWGLSAVDDMNLGQIIIDNENSKSLSKASEFMLKEYTLRNNLSILPGWISVISSISVLINRSEKWGIFLAKYNPDITEFLFGYGPGQISEYYLGHSTKYNDGLVLPHSSILVCLIFFGLFGLLIGITFLFRIIKKNYKNSVFTFLLAYFLINLLKSDSLLYLNSFVLFMFVLNYYKFEDTQNEQY
ncbi:hypothetical protein N9U28_00030 [Acidimicrobiaceae bacterium]|nr:hypothetical protein [Acidimicrobiaceae bacterium]